MLGDTLYDIVIAGGGASGVVSAIFAARENEKARILILEKSARILRKVLASGNGRCNYSNSGLSLKNYYGDDPGFVSHALENFGYKDLVAFFESLGVMSITEDGGKTYPMSLNAPSVVDALRLEITRLGIEVECDCSVTSIKKSNTVFYIETAKGKFQTKAVLAAFGSCASVSLGGSYDGYKILENLGHFSNKLSPVLVQLCANSPIGLSGLKTDVTLSLFCGKEFLESSFGELLFTDYGISGPPVFYLSKYCHFYKKLKVVVDFLPNFSVEDFIDLLIKRKKNLGHLTMENFLSGMINKKIAQYLTKESGIDKLSKPVNTLSDNEIKNLAAKIKAYELLITDTNGFKNAQVTAGGILTNGFKPETMESKNIRGLFTAGEVLDIFGDCGGFNLHWAFASGRLAGITAADLFVSNTNSD